MNHMHPRRGTGRPLAVLAVLTALLLLLPLGLHAQPTPDGLAADAGVGMRGGHALTWRNSGDAYDTDDNGDPVWNGWSSGKGGKSKEQEDDPDTNKGSGKSNRMHLVDGDFMVSGPMTDAQLRTQWAHTVTRGRGTVVAVLDGGFNLDHPTIAHRVHAFGYDAIDNDLDCHDTGNGWDDDWDGEVDGGVGHGTFVAGMILQVAPDATILPIRVRDDEGLGTDYELERGLYFAWALGAHVVNISSESLEGIPPHIKNMIKFLRRQGVVVVMAAGNGGELNRSDLAKTKDALIVGSVDRYDRIADFSNVAECPDENFIMMPGVDLFGPAGKYWDTSNAYASGTSFSTGLASGAAALVRATNPWQSADEIMERLTRAIVPTYNAWGWRQPYGRIDLWKAVQR